jgi:WD40 repeat protein
MSLMRTMQDVREGKQTLLHGHDAPITCVSTSQSRALVLTATAGADSRLIAWDTSSHKPAFAIERPHSHGVLAMDLSEDGAHLATVSQPEREGDAQEIALWDATSGTHADMLITVPVPAGDTQARALTLCCLSARIHVWRAACSLRRAPFTASALLVRQTFVSSCCTAATSG